MVPDVSSGAFRLYAECVYQDLWMPDERARLGSRCRAISGKGLHFGVIGSHGGRGLAQYVQRAGFSRTKGDWQNAEPDRRSAALSTEPSAGFHGVYGPKPGPGADRS